MKNYLIPLNLVVLASFIPTVGQYLAIQNKEVTYIPILISFVLVWITPRVNYISVRELILIIILTLYTIGSLFTGRGIGSGGTLLVIVLSIIFVKFYKIDIKSFFINLDKITKYILLLYKFNIIVIYLELFIVITGGQASLVDMFTQSDYLPGYKDYNHAHFLQYLGFNVSGLGGLYLGSQAAGMISVMSLIIFYQFKENMKSNYFWLVLAIGAVIFSSNMTALLMLFVSLFSMIFIFHSQLNSATNKMLFLLFLPLIIPLVFYKLDNPSELDIYLEAFLPSVYIFVDKLVNFKVLDLLFGYGSVGHYEFTSKGVELGTDFGLMTLINQAGLILFFISFSLIFFLNYRARRFACLVHLDTLCSKNNYSKIYNFYVTNILIINSFFLSLIHYTSAIEIGLRELFALHVALALIVGTGIIKRNF